MLHMKKGCKIQNADKLFEQYEKTEYGYIANMHVEKIFDFLVQFIIIHEEPMFFFLELPSKLDDEENPTKVSHKDVYYMDCLKQEEAFAFLHRTGELLIHDGLCCFGFGSQTSHDEIAIRKYNIVTIHCTNNSTYENLFKEFGITETENLITAWDTFSADSPGISEKIELNGKDVYSIIEDYKNWGIYFAERRIND